MSKFENVYQPAKLVTGDGLRYFFVSQGEREIIKAIEYSYVKVFNGRSLFNMGFGDYNFITGTVSDEEISNNRDHYKVFHTVLNTVPTLFDTYGDVMMMVQGSDSKPEFIAKCKVTCGKKCGEGSCKNANRRISIYRGYVDKNYDELSKDFDFLGGEGVEDHNIIEPYEKGKTYNAVFLIKKNL
jgi:hypothetical protein